MSFKDQLIEAGKSGILLFVKYILIVAAIIYAFNFSLNTRQMAESGLNAAVALNKYMSKGYLPQFNNGEIPDKPVVKDDAKTGNGN